MNPILRIVNYLLKKKDIINNEKEIDHFFDNGVSFPQFIAIIFNVDKIPDIYQNPKDSKQRNLNNSLALEFLFQKNPGIAQISPNFLTTEEKNNLLTLILTKQCFDINYEKIIAKCNLIVQSIGLHYYIINDIIKKETILSLLHVLTDKKIQIDSEIKDFNLLMSQNFEKAKVPLVIDENSLKPPNQFLFLIQILIIFDEFSDKIDQIYKNYLDSDDHLKFNKIDKLNETALLKTINGILKNEGLNFNNICEATRGDNAYRFVQLFFKEDIEFIEKLNSSQKDIVSIIKLLGTKEPIFNILLFNFKELKYEYSSSVLFYTNFLNHFFLKKSRQELFERCSTIIFSITKRDDFFFDKLKENVMDKKNPYEDKSILFMWETYLALLYFVNERSVHFNSHVHNNFFEKKNIPQVIDEHFVNKCKYQEKDALFYQLQFIFNALDSENFTFHYHEMMLSVIRLIKNIKVPKYSTLVENIRVKNVSLILQKKRYNIFLTAEKKEETNKIKFDELNMLKKEKPKNVESFKQRYVKNNELNTENHKNFTSFQSSESYWNPVNNDYSIDDGVLFMKEKINGHQIEWNDNIENYEKNIERYLLNLHFGPLFSSFPTKEKKSKCYKFFRYNETFSKWEADFESISSFFTTKLFKETNSKIPLILFSNSYENELIELNSKLINYLHPELDDDEIYVYGLSDKNLSLLEYNVILTQEKSQIKPIFLFLHIPKNKQNIKNIKIIIYKIHYFLSFICDIEVVVLNKDHFNDQIDFIKNINNIKSSYEKTVDLKEDQKSLNSTNNQSSSDDFSSDGDDDVDLEKDSSFNQQQHCLYNMNNFTENINLSYFKRHPNYIFLVNDQSIKGDIIETKKNDLMSNIKNQIGEKSCDVYYINVKDPITYRCFLYSLSKTCINITDKYDDIMNKFEMIKVTEVSNLYIEIKMKIEWKSELKNFIENRFKQYKTNNFEKSDDFLLINKLYEEIMNIYPSIDSDFYNECNLILSEIKNKITQLNNEFLSSELKISSQNNLNYLKKIINSQFYWDSDKKDSIENSHINFLEKEFYSIIDSFYSKKYFTHIFSCCESVLKNQIENDLIVIRNCFDELEKKFSSSLNNHDKPYDMLYEMDKRTDYSVRESERVREIKVIVEAGHLIDEIEQDF